MVQRRSKSGERQRISVSLDPEDYKWVQSFTGSSDSYKLSRIVHAARLAGITLDDATAGGVLEDYLGWLRSKKRRTRFETELAESLTEYLAR